MNLVFVNLFCFPKTHKLLLTLMVTNLALGNFFWLRLDSSQGVLGVESVCLDGKYRGDNGSAVRVLLQWIYRVGPGWDHKAMGPLSSNLK